MLKGRLGLDTARLPHADRHGLLWLDRGTLSVEDGCLRFVAAGSDTVAAGDYRVPHQAVSLILLGPGSTVSHDALRLLARHNTSLAAVGEGGVRFYTAQPLLPDYSALGRARAWADEKGARMAVARRMYAWYLGEVLPHRDIVVLRGIRGARAKEIYRLTAERMGLRWAGRRYDRADPLATDGPNQAINHAASAVEAAAAVAVAATATIPQLGFIHEDSGQSFVLDVADLFRDTVGVIEGTPALASTPVEQADGLRRVLFQVEEDARRGLAHSQGQLDGTVAELRGMVRGALERREQKRWLWTESVAGVLGGVELLILAMSALPWGMGMRLAALPFGGRWDAGQAFMEAANPGPGAWDRMVRLYKACPPDSTTDLCEAVLAMRTIAPEVPTQPA